MHWNQANLKQKPKQGLRDINIGLSQVLSGCTGGKQAETFKEQANTAILEYNVEEIWGRAQEVYFIPFRVPLSR